jgi:hypothetical protein
MTVDTRSEPDLQEDFRVRAIWAQIGLVLLAIVVFLTSKNGAPLMYRGLKDWWAPLLLLWTALSAISAFLALWFRAFNFRAVRCGRASDIYSGRLGTGPISPLDRPGCYH